MGVVHRAEVEARLRRAVRSSLTQSYPGPATSNLASVSWDTVMANWQVCSPSHWTRLCCTTADCSVLWVGKLH